MLTMKMKKILSLVLTFCMVFSLFSVTTSAAANPDREKASAEFSRRAATQGMVLFKNEGELLPVKEGKTVSLFGRGQVNTIKGGTGSGSVNNIYNVNILDGLKNSGLSYNEELAETYKAWCLANPPISGGWVSPPSNPEMPITLEEIKVAAASSDTGIVVISRNSGEFADRTETKGDYYLNDAEYNLIKNVKEAFGSVVVLLNVGGVIDVKFIEELNVDSVLYVSQPGQEGGNAVFDVVTGKVTPSGKLAMTWANNYTDYSSSTNFGKIQEDGRTVITYEEDIFTGYRYFDTFGVDVAYEFGYGGSYTTFDMETVSVETNLSDSKVKVAVKVTNNGNTYSGKEVVQIYVSAPKTSVEKSHQELVAFGKTDTLAPGASETVVVEFDLRDCAYFRESNSTYNLEKGNYIVRAGNSSRNTHVSGIVNFLGNKITQITDSRLAPQREINKLSSKDATPITYEGEADEIAAANVIDLKTDTVKTEDISSDYVEIPDEMVVKPENVDKTLTLKDVKEGRATLEDLIAQMSVEELARLAVGASGKMNSGEPIVGEQAHTIPGAAGESNRFSKYFIQNFVVADGPAGIRVTRKGTLDGVPYERNATAFPIGTLLAMTWDKEVVEEFGKWIGIEMIEFGVDIWLAPGMNIQRNPLCGRNFEYYSEDPLLSGKIAGAATDGVQSKGVGVTPKHYAGNQQETDRNDMNTIISERAIREIYLKGFEIVVRENNPLAIMTAYNDLNGTPCADSFDLCNAIPRGEWGFDGLIMTDWFGGQSNAALSMRAGNDLIMPGGLQKAEIIVNGVRDGMILKADVQRSAYNILGVLLKLPSFINAYESTLGVVKDGLSTAVADAKSLDISKYSKDSIALFNAVITDAEHMLTNDTYSQIQVDSMIEKVKSAKNLLNDLDTSLLEFMIKEADKQVEDGALVGVIQDVVEGFNKALKEAKAILVNADVDPSSIAQAEIDLATKNLIDALHMLDFKANKDLLKNLVALSDKYAADQALYRPATYTPFETALADAKAVLADGSAFQDEIDAAWFALANGVANLRKIPNKDALKGLLNKAKSIDSSQYTVASFAMLVDAADDANLVYDDKNSSESAVDSSEKAMKTALSGLVPLDAKTPDGTDADVTTTTKASDSDEVIKVADTTTKAATSAPKTGENSLFGLLFIVLSLSCVVVVAIRKKKVK